MNINMKWIREGGHQNTFWVMEDLVFIFHKEKDSVYRGGRWMCGLFLQLEFEIYFTVRNEVIAAVSITCLQTICLKGFISLTWHSSTSSLVTLLIITMLPYFHGLLLSLVSILLHLCVWPLSFQFFATKLFCTWQCLCKF